VGGSSRTHGPKALKHETQLLENDPLAQLSTGGHGFLIPLTGRTPPITTALLTAPPGLNVIFPGDILRRCSKLVCVVPFVSA